MIPPTNDWAPAATLEVLRQRAALLAEVRRFFDERDFIEVQTPILSHDTMIDRFIEPLPLVARLQGREHQLFLQTSPEFCMKRLLCAGARAIYQIGPAFRQAELGQRHNPEFTMLEWYRAGDDYAAGMSLLNEFCQAILNAEPAQQISYRQAFQQFAGVDPFDTPQQILASRLTEPTRGGDPLDRDDLLNQLFAELVEPSLGRSEPHLVYDWPVQQAALAKIRPGVVPVAERFELFVAGCEIANGYHELTDSDEFARRMQAANQARRLDGNPSLPEDSRLLAAMRQSTLPDSCGVAVGFDRLLMIRAGLRSIRQALAFPFDRA
jgi:lysyl-tRNA synthetase class 2